MIPLMNQHKLYQHEPNEMKLPELFEMGISSQIEMGFKQAAYHLLSFFHIFSLLLCSEQFWDSYAFLRNHLNQSD